MKHDLRSYQNSDRATLGRLIDRADRYDDVDRALAPAATDDLPLFAFAPRYPLGLERGLTRAEARGRLGSCLSQISRHILLAADGASLDACIAVYPVRSGSDALWMLDWVVDPERRNVVGAGALLRAGLSRIRMLAAEPAAGEGGASASSGAAASCSVEARGPCEDAETQRALGTAGLTAVRTFAILACNLMEVSTAGESTARGLEEVRLRYYRPGDAPAWVRAFNAAFAEHWGALAYTEESWGRHTASPRFRNRLSLVAEAGGKIAGVCHCAPSLKPDEQWLAHLHILGVHPEFRRRGLGYCLMWEALRCLRQEGFRRVELDVDTLNGGALRLYRQLGFEEKAAITIYRGQVGTGFDGRSEASVSY